MKNAKSTLEIIKSFNFTVPSNYSHQKQIANFITKYEKDFICLNKNILSFEHENLNTILHPQKLYSIEIISLNAFHFSMEDIFLLLKEKKMIGGGFQLLSLLWGEVKYLQSLKYGLIFSVDEMYIPSNINEGICKIPGICSLASGWACGIGSVPYKYIENNHINLVCLNE